MRAYCTLRKLRQPEAFRAGLLGIASRVAKETYRQKRRRPRPGSLRRETVVEPVNHPDPGAESNADHIPG